MSASASRRTICCLSTRNSLSTLYSPELRGSFFSMAEPHNAHGKEAPSQAQKLECQLGWMQRALVLAEQGTALASPNPMVGAVLVRNGKVVGEGFHTYEGRKHAEVL